MGTSPSGGTSSGNMFGGSANPFTGGGSPLLNTYSGMVGQPQSGGVAPASSTNNNPLAPGAYNPITAAPGSLPDATGYSANQYQPSTIPGAPSGYDPWSSTFMPSLNNSTVYAPTSPAIAPSSPTIGVGGWDYANGNPTWDPQGYNNPSNIANLTAPINPTTGQPYQPEGPAGTWTNDGSQYIPNYSGPSLYGSPIAPGTPYYFYGQGPGTYPMDQWAQQLLNDPNNANLGWTEANLNQWAQQMGFPDYARMAYVQSFFPAGNQIMPQGYAPGVGPPSQENTTVWSPATQSFVTFAEKAAQDAMAQQNPAAYNAMIAQAASKYNDAAGQAELANKKPDPYPNGLPMDTVFKEGYVPGWRPGSTPPSWWPDWAPMSGGEFGGPRRTASSPGSEPEEFVTPGSDNPTAPPATTPPPATPPATPATPSTNSPVAAQPAPWWWAQYQANHPEVADWIINNPGQTSGLPLPLQSWGTNHPQLWQQLLNSFGGANG